MMKELLAATTTTLVMQTATAQVPASITLYGLMDAGMGYTRLSGAYKDPATGRTLRVSKSRLGALSGGHPTALGPARQGRPGRRPACRVPAGIGL